MHITSVKYLGFIDDEWDSINFESYGKISHLSID